MKTNQQVYKLLLEKGKHIKILQSISNLVGWDQETYMPKNALAIRSLQKETLEMLVHQEKVNPAFEELLAQLIDIETGKLLHQEGLDTVEKAAIREWREDLVKAKKLPESFVKTFAKLASESVSVWGEAKEANDFKAFLPYLEKMIAMSKEKAEYLGYEEHPYDALLDEYEPGMTVKKLDKLFGKLKPYLIDLTKKLSKEKVHSAFLYGNFDPHQMFIFDDLLIKAMGLKEGSYRLDTSNHPFCSSCHPEDVRMTTVTRTKDLFAANISAVLHEAGHGLYEQGLNSDYFGTPICEALSLGIHESQSKLWECFIGQSLSFWKHFYPLLQDHFPEAFSKVSLHDFYKAINQVSPSFIRIYADEVTYSLHVIIRYEIEKAFIEGSLKAKDIPKVWEEKMEAYLGIRPHSDKEGCMQDIHWAWGAIGYFPTYVLGNLYAAQILATLKKQFPDYDERVSEGHLLFITNFLKEKIHKHGRTYSPEELITHATGKPLSEDYFIEYLNEKFK